MVILLNLQIDAIFSVLIRPNKTFKKITEKQDYFVTAVMVLVISSFFFISYSLDEQDAPLPTNELGYVLDAGKQSESFVRTLLLNILSIVIVFFIGKKLGGNNDFRKIFSVMAFAMVPVMVGGITLHVFLYNPLLLASMTGLDPDSIEFAGLFWPLYFAFIPFVFWTFVLSIKAIKVADNFGTAKAFGVFIASAVATYLMNLESMLVV